MSHINKEAERARHEEKSGGGKGNLKESQYKFQSQNKLRVLPPWSAKGYIAKRVLSHYQLPPERKFAFCLHTWPDKFDGCPVCDAIAEILSHMEVNLGRQEYSAHHYINVIDRNNEDKGVQIARITPKTYNWIVLQMDNEDIGDLTDIERGFDLVIDVQKKTNGSFEFLDYVPSFRPERRPLHEDEAVMSKWLDGIWDLDKVYPSPDTNKVSTYRQYAEAMRSFYLKRSANGSRKETSDTAKPDTVKPDRGSKPETKVEEPKRDKPKSSTDKMPTKDVPTCFAGLDDPDKHDDGSIGFKDDLEKCLLCRVEDSCMDAKHARE